MIDVGNGKQIIVSGDRGIHLKIWAYGGSLGLDLTPEVAMQVAGDLIYAVRKARKRGDAA